MTYLIIGNCGVGKTWVMNEIIKIFEMKEVEQIGLYRYLKKAKLVILGVYDGSMYQGSDKLSMGIMKDNFKAKKLFDENMVIAEGDRFTNERFIRFFKPTILRIKGSGLEGLKRRSGTQTERQINAIHTRVAKVKEHYSFNSSRDCLDFLLKEMGE